MWTSRLLLFSAVLAAAATAAAQPSAPAPYVEVQSPHFVVFSDANAKTAERVAARLEGVRAVFRAAFPNLGTDPALPIEVLALQHRRDFQQVVPQDHSGKKQAKWAGFFMAGPERNYIILLLDTGSDLHPYATIYHEYTHVLTAKAEYMPLWLTEGLAEFYQSSVIGKSDATFGNPDPANMDVMANEPFLSLPTLFAVDSGSPYYHENNKVSIFYAESWAVTHYLMTQPAGAGQEEIIRYLSLLRQHVDGRTAATQAFGDLDALQGAVRASLQSPIMMHFHLKLPHALQKAAYPEHSATVAEAEAVRGGIMAYAGRLSAAQALLAEVARQDPKNVSAREALGYVAMQQGHTDQALDWYRQAVGLGSNDFLAQYYYGAMTEQGGIPDQATAQRVRASLERAVQLNPSFAPAFDSLAVVEARDLNLPSDARGHERTAIRLDPSQIDFRINLANILMRLRRPKDAAAALEAALPWARNPGQKQQLQQQLLQINGAIALMAASTAAGSAMAGAATPTPTPAGPDAASQMSSAIGAPAALPRTHIFAVKTKPAAITGHLTLRQGTIASARCTGMRLQVDLVTAPGVPVHLHADDYSHVSFSARNFHPQGLLMPCTGGLTGLKARVAVSGGQIVSIELSR